jgi:hypothetical protein
VDPARVLAPVAGTGVSGPLNGAWSSVDVYSVLLRLAVAGGPEVERAVTALIDSANAVVPELVLLGMAASKVEEGCDADPSGHDPNPLRARYYNTLLTSAFGSILASPVRIPPSMLQATLLQRLWVTSRALAATSLLALLRGIANRAGSEHEQLRTSTEGVARVVALTMHLSEFATTLLSAPAPQLAIEVAVYFSVSAIPEVEARLAAEPLPAAWVGPPDVGPGESTPPGAPHSFRLDAWLRA